MRDLPMRMRDLPMRMRDGTFTYSGVPVGHGSRVARATPVVERLERDQEPGAFIRRRRRVPGSPVRVPVQPPPEALCLRQPWNQPCLHRWHIQKRVKLGRIFWSNAVVSPDRLSRFEEGVLGLL